MKTSFNPSCFDVEFPLSMADVCENFLKVLSISCGPDVIVDGLANNVSSFWKPNL